MIAAPPPATAWHFDDGRGRPLCGYDGAVRVTEPLERGRLIFASRAGCCPDCWQEIFTGRQTPPALWYQEDRDMATATTPKRKQRTTKPRTRKPANSSAHDASAPAPEDRRAERNQKTAPGATSTTTPAGIARVDPAARAAASETTAAVYVPIDRLQRHPDNRHPTPESIDERAKSLAEVGQLEAIVVRPIRREAASNGDAQDVLEIVSGETRWLAARQLGWNQVLARIVEMDDATALRMLAEYNAHREDLDPIQRARLIRRLCEPLEEGGGGLTREQAARSVGLESHAAAANLVRLLELPAVWQQRVAAGELPQTYARALLPIAKAPRLLAGAEKSWKDRGNTWNDDWDSRENVERLVECLVDEQTRSLADDAKHTYRSWEVGDLAGTYKRKWELTDEIRAELDVATVTIDGKDVEVATNVKRFDALMTEQIKAAAAKKTKAKAAKDEPKPTPKKETAAQRKKREKEQAEKLDRRILHWRHRWLRSLVVARLTSPTGFDYEVEAVDRFCTWLLSGAMHGRYDISIGEVWDQAAGDKSKGYIDREHRWRTIADVNDEALYTLRLDLVRAVIATPDRDPKFPIVPFEVLDDVAHELGLVQRDCWARLQADAQVGNDDMLLTEFYGLHSSDQLEALAAELGVDLAGYKTKAARVERLVGITVDVPASIRDWSL